MNFARVGIAFIPIQFLNLRVFTRNHGLQRRSEGAEGDGAADCILFNGSSLATFSSFRAKIFVPVGDKKGLVLQPVLITCSLGLGG